MVADQPITTEPVFIAGSAGQIFCIRFKRTPCVNDRDRTAVILIPPFAEDMNRTRRFFTKLRFALLRTGADQVVLPDLYGTGDSAGDFGDATWQIWVSDLCRLATELRQDGYQHVHVVGVRAGCLLIDEMIHELDVPLAHAVFVQPETSGYDVLHNLLRVRVASSRFSGGSTESTDNLWRMLENEQSVVVSGYSISATLAMALKDKRLNLEKDNERVRGHWIEVVDLLPTQGDDFGKDRSPAPIGDAASKSSTKSDFTDRDVVFTPLIYPGWRHHYIQAQPFWQFHECEPDDGLVMATALYTMNTG